MSPDEIFKQTTRHFLSPVAAFLDDPAVSEIMINGPGEVFVERGGRLVKTEAKFPDEASLRTAIVNVLQYAGKRVDPNHPMIEGRLPDGSRIHVAMDPCSRRGPVVTIRKHAAHLLTISDLGYSAADAAATEQATAAVKSGRRVMVVPRRVVDIRLGARTLISGSYYERRRPGKCEPGRAAEWEPS